MWVRACRWHTGVSITAVYCLWDSVWLWLIVLWTLVKLSSACVCAWAHLCLVRWVGFLGCLCTQFLFGTVKVEADARSGDPYSVPLGVTMAAQQQTQITHRSALILQNYGGDGTIHQFRHIGPPKKIKLVTWSHRQRGTSTGNGGLKWDLWMEALGKIRWSWQKWRRRAE